MMAEKFFLQGAAGPIRKGRTAQVEHGFVHKRDHGEDGELDVVGVVTVVAGLLIGRLQTFQDLIPESGGIGNRLAAGSQALGGGEDLLKREREVLISPRGGGTWLGCHG
jgi:hypothetical protein